MNIGLFDVFKKKNEAELFTYDEQNKEYTATIDGIEFVSSIAVTPEMTEYAKKLASIYESKLSDIADYMLEDEAFDSECGFFPNVSKDMLIASLNTPSIQLLSDKDGACTYCNHTLDNVHIITFEFSALFEELCYLSIDG